MTREKPVRLDGALDTAPTRAIYRGHIAELDAIRAIGVIWVLFGHFWPKPLSASIFALGQCAWIAMDAFFVLSGFLITGILVDSRSRSDYFRTYYTRRSLRIFPLYYLLLLALVLMAHFSRGGNGSEYAQMVHQWGSPAWFFFYLGNFKIAYMGAAPTVSALGPLWSLQVEEQFYLLLPFAIRWMRPEQFVRLLWCMVILCPLFRLAFFLWNPSNPYPQYVLLPCHMEGLALGALIAVRFRSGPWEIPKARLTVLTIGLLFAAFMGSLLSPSTAANMNEPGFSAFNRLIGYSISSWGCACLVLWLILFRGSRYTRFLRIAPLGYIATISYGIYLLHQFVWRAERGSGKLGIHLAHDGLARFLVLVGVTILVATVSWHAFERPWMHLKDRLAPSSRSRQSEKQPEGALLGA